MKQQSYLTAITLAASASFANAVVKEIMGKEVADTINGDKVTPSALAELTACTLDAQFNQHRLV